MTIFQCLERRVRLEEIRRWRAWRTEVHANAARYVDLVTGPEVVSPVEIERLEAAHSQLLREEPPKPKTRRERLVAG